jgi:rRNA methylases
MNAKLVRSLRLKKFREHEGLFVAEGIKMVEEALVSGLYVSAIYVTQEELFVSAPRRQCISEREMAQISHFSSPSPAIAIVKIPKRPLPKVYDAQALYIGLDAVRDPGNLGTILRIADWFGIKAIFASLDTVDAYNPKVIQASMGAVFRIPVYYAPLEELILNSNLPVLGTVLEGHSLYETDFEPRGLILMGSEAHGLSQKLLSLADRLLYIPSYPHNVQGSESLNVAIATAIICAECRRRSGKGR